jgi:hypothetical protein
MTKRMVAIFDELYQIIDSDKQLKAMLTLEQSKRVDEQAKITFHPLPKQKAQWKTERKFRK